MLPIACVWSVLVYGCGHHGTRQKVRSNENVDSEKNNESWLDRNEEQLRCI